MATSHVAITKDKSNVITVYINGKLHEMKPGETITLWTLEVPVYPSPISRRLRKNGDENNMSIPFPEGAIIVSKGGYKRKILGACGEAVFLSCIDLFDRAAMVYATQKQLTDEGYTLLEEPWKPKGAEEFYFVDFDGEVEKDACWTEESINCLKIAGNLFRTRKLAEAAALRVKKAYKGE